MLEGGRMLLFRLIISILLWWGVVAGCYGDPVPSSQRSRSVISQVKPGLAAELSQDGFAWGAPVFMRIFKKEKKLELWLGDHRGFRLFKSYTICTYGGQGLGPKTVQGDGKAPEGFYYVAPRQLNPYSDYYLAFNLGYPNAYDRVHRRTGSALMVHGYCVSIGCFAMTNKQMSEIYTLADAALRNGQTFFRVHIFPFRMTKSNMKKNASSPWIVFWRNLKRGYDMFEERHSPPNVVVRDRSYCFEP
ncbi:MAG: murein L,D-transpeptidase [Desulfobacteraceae bacterium]|nr:murein L,D-transpeptidase [Desulfobacteraceae bacterium]